MKNRIRYRKWMCLNLIMFILLSGMCYESVKADSLLQCLHTGTIKTRQSAHQLNDTFRQAVPNECREEVFGVKSLDSRLCAIRRTSRFRGISTILLAYLLAIIIVGRIIWTNRIILLSAMTPCYQQMIISYIHQKDGAKG